MHVSQRITLSSHHLMWRLKIINFMTHVHCHNRPTSRAERVIFLYFILNELHKATDITLPQITLEAELIARDVYLFSWNQMEHMSIR